MNFKYKSRWKYCFIIVFPNANKTILIETKIYLLLRGHFQMKFNLLSINKANKLIVEILLIKWYTKCYVEMESDLLNKTWKKLFGKGSESEFFYNIYWKKSCQIMFWKDTKEDFLEELHMKYCTNRNRYNSVIRFLLFQMCTRHFCHRGNKWSLERFDVKLNKFFKRDINIELSQCLFF